MHIYIWNCTHLWAFTRLLLLTALHIVKQVFKSYQIISIREDYNKRFTNDDSHNTQQNCGLSRGRRVTLGLIGVHSQCDILFYNSLERTNS